MRIAILGANGFIGSRLTENLYLTRFALVRPIVRSYQALAGLSRFDFDFRVVDRFDQNNLRDAFSGCDAVVHCAAGDPPVMIDTIQPVYSAAQYAGVQRLVYLSSAMVHGQMPAPGTHEESFLDPRQTIPYNNAKVRAEKMLLKLRKKGKVEVVILRPGVVYGPRSSLIIRFAYELLNGNAYLINKGKGICNSIYVDNLVHAIKLALSEEDIDKEAFILRDSEQITWAEMYHPVAEYLGFSLDEITDIQSPFYITDEHSNYKNNNESKVIKSFVSAFPRKYNLDLSSFDSMIYKNNSSPWIIPKHNQPSVDFERLLLYSCEYALPWKKAYKFLNYEPIVSFSEACQRITGWMEFAGFPRIDKKIKHLNDQFKSVNTK